MKYASFVAAFCIILALCATSAAQSPQQIDSLVAASKANPKEDTSKISTLVALSLAYQETDPGKGVAVADEALALASKLNQNYYLAEAKKAKANNLVRSGKFDEAFGLYEAAIKLYQQLGMSNKAGQSIKNLGVINGMLSNFDKSLEYLEQALKIFTEIGDLKQQAICMEQIANVLGTRSDNAKAITYFDKALKVYTDLGATAEMISLQQNKSIIYYQQGQYSKTLSCLQAALKLVDQTGDKSALPGIQTTLGNLYMRLGDYSTASTHFLKAEATEKSSGNQFGLSQCIVNTANVYNLMGKKSLALEKYQSALELQSIVKDPKTTAICLTNIGSVYLDQADYEKSYQALTQASQIATEHNLPDLIASNNSLMATLISTAPNEFLKQKGIALASKYTLAENKYQSSLKIYQESNDLPGVATSWDKLRRLYDKLGNSDKAYSAYQNYVLFRDSTAGEAVKNQITRKEMEFEFEKERVQKQSAYEAGLNRQKLIQTGLGIGLGLLAIILILAARAYRSKQKSNTLITAQNEKLEVLNQTKDKLFNIIGHDLRKPAMSFRGIAKKVNYLIKTNDVATLNQYGHEIEKNANDMNGLIDNLLGWSLLQKDGIKLRPVNLNLFHAIADTIDLLQDIATEKQIKISNNVPESLMINVDEHSLKIILRNLVHNAIKFTPNGGEIHFSSVTENQTIQLRIRDTGVGMTAGELSEIFKFQAGTSTRGTENEKGTGLGLYIVDQWAKLNKIKLLATSEKGRGTTFDLGFALV